MKSQFQKMVDDPSVQKLTRDEMKEITADGTYLTGRLLIFRVKKIRLFGFEFFIRISRNLLTERMDVSEWFDEDTDWKEARKI